MLTIENFSYAYVDKNVLHSVSLRVESGEVVSVVGHNGAGKSTLLKCVSGVLNQAKGKVAFREIDVANVPPFSAARIGMSYSPDQKPIFQRMTVLENLEMGGLREKNEEALKRNEEKVFAIFPKLHELRHRSAGVLSGGERQMLAMGIALMSSPSLILLDEPSAGLAPMIVNQLFGAIKKINEEERISFLVVEQSVDLIEDISDRVYLLKSGKVVLEGTPEEVKHSEQEHLLQA